MFKFLFISGKKSRDEKTDLLGAGGRRGSCPSCLLLGGARGGGAEVPFEL